MLKMMRKRNGQSTLEYAILIIIIIAALLTLQTYIKRGLSGRLKDATDDIGDQYSESNTAEFHKRTHSIKNSRDTVKDGVTTSSLRADAFTNVTQNIKVGDAEEHWGK
jgi:hypothetical protein